MTTVRTLQRLGRMVRTGERTMFRWLLFVLAIVGTTSPTAFATEYILQVETVGYIDKPAGEAKPEETVLRAIEVVGQPNSVFYGKAKIGKHSVLLIGRLSAAEGGDFVVDIRYVDAFDTGVTIPNQNGEPKRVLNTTSSKTTITVSLGDPVVLGGLNTTSVATLNGTRRHTRTNVRHVFVLNRFEPE
jgi:hypothetical protein